MGFIGRRIREALRGLSRVVRHYLRDIIIALVLAVVAAILIDQYYNWARLEAMQNNRRAVATVMALDQRGRAVRRGSGLFITSHGLLVTAYHVVKGAAAIRAHLPSGAFYILRGIPYEDETTDIAVLQFDATETPSVRRLGDSDKLRVGEEVYAIGTPASLEGTLSTGNISNLAQEVGGRSFIQFTASISPGSSGGGLFNRDGKVIGITAAFIASAEAQNLNLAIPINSYRDVLTGAASGLTRDSPERYYSLGNIADNKEEWDEAIRCYQKAISLDANYVDAYKGLGGVYFEKGQFDLEVEQYLKATQIEPNNADSFYWLGTAYEDVGNLDSAIAAYVRALEIDPNRKEALHDLVIAYLAEGKVNKARELLPRLAKLNAGWGNKLERLLERIR
ncbi:MAG: trypsin-like peptidase domain-containing protein [Candidatus Binataceae bacterium]